MSVCLNRERQLISKQYLLMKHHFTEKKSPEETSKKIEKSYREYTHSIGEVAFEAEVTLNVSDVLLRRQLQKSLIKSMIW